MAEIISYATLSALLIYFREELLRTRFLGSYAFLELVRLFRRDSGQIPL